VRSCARPYSCQPKARGLPRKSNGLWPFCQRWLRLGRSPSGLSKAGVRKPKKRAPDPPPRHSLLGGPVAPTINRIMILTPQGRFHYSYSVASAAETRVFDRPRVPFLHTALGANLLDGSANHENLARATRRMGDRWLALAARQDSCRHLSPDAI